MRHVLPFKMACYLVAFSLPIGVMIQGPYGIKILLAAGVMALLLVMDSIIDLRRSIGYFHDDYLKHSKL